MDTSVLAGGIVLVLAAWFLYSRMTPVKGLKSLDEEQFRSALEQTRGLLVDVREPHEYKSGHIPGAKNIPLSGLSQKMSELPKDRDIFLYCRSGMRSSQAAKLLGRAGFTKLSHLKGGINIWRGKTKK
ncbi:rhodanese-like domain-containing protein [Paenibacillus sp. 1P03SA]|uniref:rhodanese-like domain-containing protein n=1 Tax=Paenibacillus sp. 1P03SA TaxID=3132294 RepID=UPI0039A142A4